LLPDGVRGKASRLYAPFRYKKDARLTKGRIEAKYKLKQLRQRGKTKFKDGDFGWSNVDDGNCHD
jgi:hypothetical protein